MAALGRQMSTLNYASLKNEPAGIVRSAIVFLPALAAIAAFIISFHWRWDDFAFWFLMFSVSISDVATIVVLCAWRRRLNLIVTIAGWTIVGLCTAYLGFVAAVNLGILQE